jgi:hypothetical protein
MDVLAARSVGRLTAGQAVERERLQPWDRGYWLDDEILDATGLSSVPLLRKVQALGWLVPDQVPVPGGGRRRAWPFREVLCAEILVAVAGATLLPVQTIALLLKRAGRVWVEAAADVEGEIARIAAPNQPPKTRENCRLVISNMTNAWVETEPGLFVPISSNMVPVGPNMNIPAVRDSRPTQSSLDQLLEGARATTILNIGNFQFRVTGQILEGRSRLRIDDERS